MISSTIARRPRWLMLAIGCALCALSGLTTADPLSDALDHPDRPAADRARDVTSQPARILQFARLPESGVVVDLFGGGGYYSEIITRSMTDSGRVYLHNNAAYVKFTADALKQRLQRDRLPNVVRYDREIGEFDLPQDSVDLVIAVLSYHDIYYKTEGWDLDPARLFATIHDILKPGGTLLIIDHIALAGSGKSAAEELHRIDPVFALEDIRSHGFEFAGELDVLKNTTDPLNISVFDDSVRRQTSRFVYKFVEPAD
jgi:predicted methyltransferase